MSRIGRQPIAVPQGVTVEIGESNRVSVQGAKGELRFAFSPAMIITREDDTLWVKRPSDSKTHRSLHGLTRSLLSNMVQGVSQGYEKNLELSGVGYRVAKEGESLVLQVGFSRPVEFKPPEGVGLEVEGTNRIKVLGIDKQLVGEVAAQLRRLRPPDAYKGKGIRYAGEKLRLKPGKAGRVGLRK
ncbi:MAG: 50S ribosomal protein L6 [Dehalococcoidia bacterium]